MAHIRGTETAGLDSSVQAYGCLLRRGFVSVLVPSCLSPPSSGPLCINPTSQHTWHSSFPDALASPASHYSSSLLWGRRLLRTLLAFRPISSSPHSSTKTQKSLCASHQSFPRYQIQGCSQSSLSLHCPVALDTGEDRLVAEARVSGETRLALLFSSPSGHAVVADFHPSLPRAQAWDLFFL